MNVNVRLKMALAEDLLGFSLDSPRTSLCFRLRKALREVEPGRKGWNELLQKAPPWEQNGWMCLQARYFLRFGAVHCHVDPQQASAASIILLNPCLGFEASPQCRRNAVEVAQKKQIEGQKENLSCQLSCLQGSFQ